MTPRQRIFMLIDEVAASHGYNRSDILKTTRVDKIVKVRDEAIYEVWKGKCLTLTKLGKIFGRDHSSVYSSLGRHMNRVGIKHKYAEAYRMKKVNQLKINRKAPALSDAA